MYVLIKGGPTHRPYKRDLRDMSKDELHHRRKQLEGELRPTLFTKDQMQQRDCKDKNDEEKRVRDYMQSQKTNEPKMREWSNINREFKRRGEEGRVHSPDDLRGIKSVRYD